MKALLRKASDYKYEQEIELNELEDLLSLIDMYGLVVGYTAEGETLRLTVTIYDDYLE